jgi:hypothetical protein
VGLAVVLVAAGVFCAARQHTDPPVFDGQSDTRLFGAVVDRVRAGESYYPAMGRELAAQGYPSGSPFNWRLPTLTIVQAFLPSLGASRLLLTAIGFIAVGLWLLTMRGLPMAALLAAGLLLATSLPLWPWFSAPSILLHDLWAGELIFLALALHARDRRMLSWVTAMVALSIREHVVVFVLIMGIAAVLSGRRREALGWLAGVALFGAFEWWHATQLEPFMLPTREPPGWLAFGGWCFVLLTTRVNVLLLLASGWWLAVLVPLALIGLLLWSSAAGRRVAATVVAYLALFSVVGRLSNWYWGLLVAPLLPLGVIGWLHAATARRRGMLRLKGD